MAQYKLAEQTFGRVEQTSKSYVFATKGLGDVYRGMTGIARIRQDSSSANSDFARSQEKYREAVQLNKDVSEAYVGLGRLYEDNGFKDKAISAYGQAIRVRPEVPQSYYYYSLAIAEKNPGTAAAYAKAYLKLERQVFKQGEKASNATKVAGRRPPPTPTPTPTASPTSTRTVTPTPTPTPTPIITGAQVKVPDVDGKKPDEALRKLREKGLEGQLRDQADCKASGKVVGTDPRKDAKVPQGSMVTVFVSSAGENAVTVPSVTNQPLREAQQELQRLGLVVDSRRNQATNAVPENTVLKQNPEANQKLKPGCTVELTISVRVKLIRVPNFIGLSRQEALRQLPRISLGGLIRGNVSEVNSNSPPGTVIDQNPKPGEMVQPETSVDLVISRSRTGDDVGESKGAVVPNLIGMTLDQAQSALAKANLTLGKVSNKVATGNEPVNRVVNQYPKAFQKIPVGSAVNVTISYQIQ